MFHMGVLVVIAIFTFFVEISLVLGDFTLITFMYTACYGLVTHICMFCLKSACQKCQDLEDARCQVADRLDLVNRDLYREMSRSDRFRWRVITRSFREQGVVSPLSVYPVNLSTLGDIMNLIISYIVVIINFQIST